MSRITIKWKSGTVFVGFCLWDIRGKRFLKYHEHDILAMIAGPVFGGMIERPRPGRDGAFAVEGVGPIRLSLGQVPVEVRHNVSRGEHPGGHESAACASGGAVFQCLQHRVVVVDSVRHIGEKGLEPPEASGNPHSAVSRTSFRHSRITSVIGNLLPGRWRGTHLLGQSKTQVSH